MIDFLTSEVKDSFLPGHKLHSLLLALNDSYIWISNNMQDIFLFVLFIGYLIIQKYKPFRSIFTEKRIKSLEKYNLLFFAIFLLFLIFYTYRELFQTYFQGDEWYYAQLFLPYSKSWSGLFESIKYSILNLNEISGGGHLTPIANFIFPLSFMYFGFNFALYAFTSLVLHFINSLLVTLVAWKLFSNKTIAATAGIFFALVQNHSESFTWVFFFGMANLAVTFFLLAFLLLINLTKQQVPKKTHIFAFFILILAALFTKETTVVLFPIFFFYLLLSKKIKSKIFLTLITTSLIYFPIRFITPMLLPKSTIVNTSAAPIFDLSLTIFRALTYSMKSITEVFISMPKIIEYVEYLTPLAYPYFAVEEKVRGTNYLMFTQTAGSDMIIYVFSLVFIIIWLYLVSKYKNNNLFYPNILLSAFIIVISSIPLLMIAFISPAAAYVTFIDSRHLYLPSIGASFLFAIVIYHLAFNTNKHISKYGGLIVLMLIIFWGQNNYNLIQDDMRKKVTFGKERTTLLNEVLGDLKTVPDKLVVHIDSDSVYYGFGDLMPPFQTNFGQVVADHLYQRNQIPVELLDTSYLTKRGIVAQGYREYNGRGFGYFISLHKVARLVEQGKITPEDMYSYKWEGKEIKASDVTTQNRKKVQEIVQKLSVYKDWKKITFEDINLSIKIPPTSILTDEKINDPTILAQQSFTNANKKYNFIILKRTEVASKGQYEDISDFKDSTGSIIGSNFYVHTIPLISGEQYIVKTTSLGPKTQMYIPTIFPDKIIQLTIDEPAQKDKKILEAETILSLIQYPEVE
jgi:hypothetical protein